MSDIASFVAKKRKQVKENTIEEKVNKLPWYRRPIEKTAFVSRKAKDGKFYVHHCEWTPQVWIGPYKDDNEVLGIINAYVEKSLKTPLDREPHNVIHSVWVDDDKDFFC